MAKILISYRRSDSAAFAGRICDRLIARYGSGSVFLDIDSIPFATDFRDHVRDTLRQSDVVIAVVGPRWLGAADGHVRIQDEDDPVRVEIELALQAGIPVFPVLVDGAAMPGAPQLPESLKRFAFINAAPVDAGRDFHPHVDRLIRSLDRILGPKSHTTQAIGAASSWTASASRGEAIPASRAGAARGVLDRLRGPVVWAVGGALVLPFAAALGSLAPPWPPGVAIITAVIEAVALILAHQRLRTASRAAVNRVVVAGAVGLGVASCAYLLAASVYTYQTPVTKERWVKGFACAAEAQMIYPEKCPHLGVDELRGAEYEAERLWTVQSIAIVKVGLVALWLVAFLSVAMLIAGFLAHHAQAHPDRETPDPR